MADDTITTVGRHLAHRRPSADEVGRLTAEIEALRHDLERHIEIASQEAMRADGIEARLTAENARLREALTAILDMDRAMASADDLAQIARRSIGIARTALNERGQGG